MHPSPLRRAAPPVILAAALAGLLAAAAIHQGSPPRHAAAQARDPEAVSTAPPKRRDLEGMRLGLMMLGSNAGRALAAAGIEADPEALTLAQLRALHAILSRTHRIGPEERRRLAAVLAR